jgi:predicted secreted protein
MKKLSRNNIAVVVIVFSIIACLCSLRAASSKPIQVKTLTGDDSGKTLIIKLGESFVLTLPDRVDGGFRYNKEQYDSTVLRLDKHYQGAPTPDARPGRPGSATWEFIAVKKGKSILKLTVSRPWAATDSITNFQNIVLVK